MEYDSVLHQQSISGKNASLILCVWKPGYMKSGHICCKQLEHIIYSYLFSHYNILCDEQHGFQRNRSCETQVLSTVHDLAKYLNDGLQTDVIFLDFSKAFDKVDHNLLLHKLKHYSIRGQLLLWLTDFLSERKQQIVVEGIIALQLN